MAERIYAVGDDGSLVGLDEAPYESEDVLQKLIEQHPGVLAGEQMDVRAPRRWVVVSREMGVPDDEDGSDRWWTDHLLLDQDATPTLVEVKRAEDTRIRREVVGQMLDYAANAVAYWSSGRVRAAFEARAADAPAEIAVLAGSDGIANADDFWSRVELNLRAGRVRMVFVADEIPPELKRIIEFLNGQMHPADVVGVELKQFVGEGVRILVPRVVGASVPSKTPQRSPARLWDRDSFLTELSRRHGDSPATVEAAERVLELAERDADEVTWGRGATDGSLYARLAFGEVTVRVFSLWTYGKVTVEFQELAKTAAFASQERRQELAARLNQIENVLIPGDRIGLYPSFDVAALAPSEAFEQFHATFEWIGSMALEGRD